MGYISISHCKNALFLGWCEKNGIDIGRRIGKFQKKFSMFLYEKKWTFSLTAEKLRLKTRLWVLKEASIKWDNGSLFNGLSDWEVTSNLKECFNKTKNITLTSYFFDYSNWYIGLVNKSIKLKLNNIEENF